MCTGNSVGAHISIGERDRQGRMKGNATDKKQRMQGRLPLLALIHRRHWLSRYIVGGRGSHAHANEASTGGVGKGRATLGLMTKGVPSKKSCKRGTIC